MDRAEIQHKIEQLKAERDRFVQQANLQIAKVSGAIEALESLVQEEEPEEQGE